MEEKIIFNCRVHGLLDQDKIKKGGIERGKQRYRCVTCRSVHKKKHYDVNREKIRARAAEWRKNNPEKVKKIKSLSAKKNIAKNRDKKREREKNYGDKNKIRHSKYNHNKVNNLYDSYVVQLIKKGTELKTSDIPKSMIDLKKELLRIRKLISERKEKK